MSKEKKVVTIKGETLPISNCRQFDKNWYKIGDVKKEESGDCYFIKEKYYREETGAIVFNNSINEYVIKDNSLINGVVNILNGKIKFGYFEKENNFTKVTLENGNEYFLLDYNSVNMSKEYREKLSDGNFYHIKSLPSEKFNLIRVPSQEYKTSLPYDSKGITDKFLSIYEKNYIPEVSDYINNYSSVLGDLTFGLEFETVSGFIPNRIINSIGLIPLRDGSISGIEYVTVPLSGSKGLQYIKDVSDILKERTTYDNSCSLHQHVGNIPRTKEFILSFFKLTCSIQDEIFQMFPLFKKYNLKVKNKNYSKPYDVYGLLSKMDPVINENNINENFNVIYSYLSGGQNFNEIGNDLKNVQFHPNDPNGNQKWMIKNRYYVHNLIPLIFGNKQTVEFRIHTPTYDVNKIIPFILINSIIVNYAIINQDNILSVKGFLCNKKLSNIIVEYLRTLKLKDATMLYDSLVDYIEIRKRTSENQTANGSIIGDEEKIRVSSYIDWNKLKASSHKNIFKEPFYKYMDGFVTDPYEREIDKLTIRLKKGNINEAQHRESFNNIRSLQSNYRKVSGLPEIPILQEEL